MPSGRTNNFPESGRGLGHVTPTIFGSTVGYPSDSLASCILCYVLLWRNKRWMDIDELLYYWLLYIHWLLLTKEHCPKPDETKQEISDKTNKDEHQSSVKCWLIGLLLFLSILLFVRQRASQGPDYTATPASDGYTTHSLLRMGRIASTNHVARTCGNERTSGNVYGIVEQMIVGDGLTQFSYYYSQLYKRLSVSHHKWVYSV